MYLCIFKCHWPLLLPCHIANSRLYFHSIQRRGEAIRKISQVLFSSIMAKLQQGVTMNSQPLHPWWALWHFFSCVCAGTFLAQLSLFKQWRFSKRIGNPVSTIQNVSILYHWAALSLRSLLQEKCPTEKWNFFEKPQVFSGPIFSTALLQGSWWGVIMCLPRQPFPVALLSYPPSTMSATFPDLQQRLPDGCVNHLILWCRRCEC